MNTDNTLHTFRVLHTNGSETRVRCTMTVMREALAAHAPYALAQPGRFPGDMRDPNDDGADRFVLMPSTVASVVLLTAMPGERYSRYTPPTDPRKLGQGV